MEYQNKKVLEMFSYYIGDPFELTLEGITYTISNSSMFVFTDSVFKYRICNNKHKNKRSYPLSYYSIPVNSNKIESVPFKVNGNRFKISTQYVEEVECSFLNGKPEFMQIEGKTFVFRKSCNAGNLVNADADVLEADLKFINKTYVFFSRLGLSTENLETINNYYKELIEKRKKEDL